MGNNKQHTTQQNSKTAKLYHQSLMAEKENMTMSLLYLKSYNGSTLRNKLRSTQL